MTTPPHPAVARLLIFTESEKHYGTAVVCRDASGRKAILTCAHLFPPAGFVSAKLLFPDCQPVTAILSAADRLFDLAVLTAEFYPLDTADAIPLAAASPPIGAPLTFPGYGMTGVYTLHRGVLTHYTTLPAHAGDNFLLAAGTASPGDSGTPILTAAGELAGILWGADETSIIGTGLEKIRGIMDKAASPAILR